MPTEQIIESPTTRSTRSADVENLASFELPPSALPAEVVDPDGRSPRWARLALLVLLVTTAGTYLWNLAASGYGNSFYAAAVEAGSKSWKAMFFGSIDPSNFITVDKPPAALWVMELSARIFGFNTWSVMVPGVLEGVAAVALLYAAVRRVTNPTAGLVAGAVLAATPVAALMFRFDNPDALLVLLLVGAAYCMTRAIEKAGTKWLLAVGTLLGFAFLTKMMQAFTVVPAFALAYLIAAPTSLRRRALQLLGSLGALIVAGGWWVVIVSLVPAADRPFIDGSPDNSIWNLIFVYNGFGRLSGSGSGGGSNFSGAAGALRLFNDAMGGQASWLLPAGLVGLVGVLVARRRAPRTDKVRAAAIIWGGWLLVTGAVFSYGKGVIHTYYTVALAPAIAALVAIGAHQLWKERERIWARAVAAGAVLLTAGWAWALLDRTPSWNPALRWLVVVTGVVGAALLLGAPAVLRRWRYAGIAIAAFVGLACLTGPVAYTADTIATAHTGSIPTAGPASAQGLGGGGSPGGGAGLQGGGTAGGRPTGSGTTGRPTGGSTTGRPTSGAGFPGGTAPKEGKGGTGLPSSTHSSGSGATKSGSSATGGRATGSGTTDSRATGKAAGGRSSEATASSRTQGGMTSGAGGGGGGATTSAALARALESDASHYKWVAAVEGSQSAASLELATSGDAVMAIGGFNGEGGKLTLSAFKAYVAKGEIHYYVAGSSGGGGGRASSAISDWVASHFTAKTIGGQTVYDLTSSTSSSSS
jgi:4-amino-4-deoxy-L-arabinose transferase-like glycosyltransferase